MVIRASVSIFTFFSNFFSRSVGRNLQCLRITLHNLHTRFSLGTISFRLEADSLQIIIALLCSNGEFGGQLILSCILLCLCLLLANITIDIGTLILSSQSLILHIQRCDIVIVVMINGGHCSSCRDFLKQFSIHNNHPINFMCIWDVFCPLNIRRLEVAHWLRFLKKIFFIFTKPGEQSLFHCKHPMLRHGMLLLILKQDII